MADDELHPDGTASEREASAPPTGAPMQGAEDAEPGHAPAPRREDEVSWLGCLWLIIVPGIIFAAVVITLNWLGC
jgi:hypothetical protein